jgi:beta-phosphoglucomutase-like phosphatase (HAD superfamily)
MPTELVIFDCDGVLVDSEAIVIEIEAALLTAAGFPLTADDIADRFVGLSYPDMMAALQADFERPVPDGLSEKIQADALAAFPDQLQPVVGMAEMLAGDDSARCVALSADPAHCLVVEDSPHGVTAARTAGMDVVGFVGGRHARPSLRTRLEAAGAELIVDNPGELATRISR